LENIKTSTKIILTGAVIFLLILVASPFAFRFGVMELMMSLRGVVISLIGATLVLITALVYMMIANRNVLPKDRNLLVLGALLSLIPIITIGPQIVKVRSVPAIHDITTDTENPPMFNAIVKLRENAPNGLEYGSTELPAAELGKLQKTAYPNIAPIETSLTVSEAISRAEKILEDQGLEIVSNDASNGLLEATDTTMWFGFKDDVVVRVSEEQQTNRVDVRSVSRVGVSDVGANAARIEKFLEAF